MISQQQTCISPEPGGKANRQWSQVGWMLTHHWNGLLSSSFSLILDSSFGLWVSTQSAGDLVFETSQLRILHSAEEDNLSPFDSKSLACARAMKLTTNIRVTHICETSYWQIWEGPGPLFCCVKQIYRWHIWRGNGYDKLCNYALKVGVRSFAVTKLWWRQAFSMAPIDMNITP